MTFQSETWPEVERDIRPLLVEHWREIALDHGKIPLDPDYERYAQAHAQGTLAFTTARHEGRLVGYYASFVTTHPHYKSTLFGFVDIYWLHPDFRTAANGMRLFAAMEQAMRKRGVRKLISMTKLHRDVSPLFERLGWQPVETNFSKVLE